MTLAQKAQSARTGHRVRRLRGSTSNYQRGCRLWAGLSPPLSSMLLPLLLAAALAAVGLAGGALITRRLCWRGLFRRRNTYLVIPPVFELGPLTSASGLRLFDLVQRQLPPITSLSPGHVIHIKWARPGIHVWLRPIVKYYFRCEIAGDDFEDEIECYLSGPASLLESVYCPHPILSFKWDRYDSPFVGISSLNFKNHDACVKSADGTSHFHQLMWFAVFWIWRSRPEAFLVDNAAFCPPRGSQYRVEESEGRVKSAVLRPSLNRRSIYEAFGFVSESGLYEATFGKTRIADFRGHCQSSVRAAHLEQMYIDQSFHETASQVPDGCRFWSNISVYSGETVESCTKQLTLKNRSGRRDACTARYYAFHDVLAFWLKMCPGISEAFNYIWPTGLTARRPARRAEDTL